MTDALLIVDIDSLYYCARQKFERKINYSKLMEDVKKDFNITRAIAYGKTNDKIDLNGFIGVLQYLQFETKFLDLHDCSTQAAVDIFKMLVRLKQVVIVSSRKTFKPLIEFLKDQGIEVLVYSCGVPRDLKITSWAEIPESITDETKVVNRLIDDVIPKTTEPVVVSPDSVLDSPRETTSGSA